MRHAKESVAESVALGTGDNFHGEVAFGDGHGNVRHFLQVGDHIIKGSRESADFVVTVNVDVLVEISGIANFARYSDEVSERLADGLRSLDSREDPDDAGQERAQCGKAKANITGTFSRFGGFVRRLSDVRVNLIEDSRGFCKPGCRIFLEIENLQVRDGSVTGIDLVALGKERLSEIVSPACLGAFDLKQMRFKALAAGLRFAAF